MRQIFSEHEYIQNSGIRGDSYDMENSSFQRYEMGVKFMPRLPINMLT
jgi:hypothetical protein